MKDGDKPNWGGGPDRRKAKRSTPQSRQLGGPQTRGGAAAGAGADGLSGYGSESVRPHLRAQLRLKELMAGTQLGMDTGKKRIRL